MDDHQVVPETTEESANSPASSSVVHIDDLEFIESNEKRQHGEDRQPLGEKSVNDFDQSKPAFVAMFLSLDVSFVSNLPLPVLQKIEARANELEALKSQRLLDEVNFEQSIHSSNAKVNSMKQQLDSTLAECQELRSHVSNLETEKSKIQTELTTLRTESGSSDDQISSFQSKLDRLLEEKRQASETLERKNNEYRELRNDYEALLQKNQQSRNSISELENESSKLRSELMSAQLRMQHLTNEVESLKRSNQWLDEQLTSKSEELKNFRSDKLKQITSLQIELDSVQGSYNATLVSHEALKEKYVDVQKAHDTSLVKVSELQSEKAVIEDGFRVEMTSQKRLGELWEKASNDAKQRIRDLEQVLEKERQQGIDDLAKASSEVEKEKVRADKLEQQLQRLEVDLEGSLVEAPASRASAGPTSALPLTPINRLNKASAGMAVFSPSAQIISDLRKDGKSLVQLYAEFQETKLRLQKERYKNESLRSEMDQILSEMESRAPEILHEREENRRLQVELAELSVQLENSVNEASELKAKLSVSEINMRDAERENGLMTRQINDLSRQVQHLLIQLQMLSDSEPPLNPTEHAQLQRLLNGESDTDRLISQRLVLFKNIIELQQQNEQLLKITRELGQRMENEENETKRKLENLESAAVQEAKEAILILQEDLKRLQTQQDSLKRERDMFRRMLSNKVESSDEQVTNGSDGPPVISEQYARQLLKQNEETAAVLREVNKNYEDLKSENAVTVKSLNDQVSTLNDARGQLQINLSKVQSQLELSNERYKNLNDNLQLLKSENGELKKLNQSLQETLSKQDVRTQQVAEEVIDAKSLAESMRNESLNLKAEKTLWKSIEARLVKENSDLLEERGRLNGVILSLQTMESEREATDSERKRKLYAQVESLENQVTSLQKRLDAESDEVKRLSVRKDHEASEYQNRIDHIQSELVSNRESLSTIRSDRDKLEGRTKELEIHLKLAEEKLVFYQTNRPKGEQESNEVKMAEDISTLQNELEMTKKDLKTAQDHIREMTDVASAAEEALQSMNLTHDEYKECMDAKLVDKENELAGLQENLKATTDMLNQSNEELSAFRQEESKKLKSVEEEKTKLEERIKEFEANEDKIGQSQSSIKTELERQAQIAKDAHENYERELVKHADAASNVQKLRTEVGSLKEQLLELTTTAQSAKEQLDNSEASWNSQRYSYEHEIESLKSRVEDLGGQNKVLLDHLESVSSRVNKFSQNVSNMPTSTTTPSSLEVNNESSEEQLREIIGYLKREKEIVDCNYELALQETKRLKQQLDHTMSDLDQVRVDLERERQREDETIRISSEHQKVLQQLNDLNILRESNSQLRSQCEYYNKKSQDLEIQVYSLKQQMEPLDAQLREAIAENEAKAEKVRLIQEDNDRWKNRAQQLLQKYDRVDPEELQGLKDEVASLKSNIEALQKEKQELAARVGTAESQNLQSTNTTSELQTKFAEVQAQLESKEQELEVKSKDYRTLEARYGRLMDESKDKLAKRRTEVAGLRKEIEDLRTAGTSLSSSNDERIQALTDELEATKRALENAKTEAENAIAAKDIRIDDLESEINKLSDDIVELQRTKTVDANSATTNSAVEVATAELTKIREEKVELEGKLQELVKELERLKQTAPTAVVAPGEQVTAIPEGYLSAQEVEQKISEAKEGLVPAKEVEQRIIQAKSEAQEKVKEGFVPLAEVEQQINEAKAEVQRIAEQQLSDIKSQAAASMSQEQIEQKVKEVKEALETQVNEAIAEVAKTNPDFAKVNSKWKVDQLEQMKANARNSIKAKVTEFQQKFHTREQELEAKIKQLEEADGAATASGADQAEIDKLRKEFQTKFEQQEKMREDLKKEHALKLRLFENKAERLSIENNALKQGINPTQQPKQAQTPAATTTTAAATTAPIDTGSGNQNVAAGPASPSPAHPSRRLMVPGQQQLITNLQQPQPPASRPGGIGQPAVASANRPTLATTASRLPMGRGGLNRPTILRPGIRRTSGSDGTEQGNKRSVSGGDGQQQKRRKEDGN